MIKIALSKGRLGDSGAQLLEKCRVDIEVLKKETRKLVLKNDAGDFEFYLVKPSDVPTYVEYGVVDLGIVGKDTLIEEDRDIYEMLDLNYGHCRLCIAGRENQPHSLTNSHLRVATKYENTARKLYKSRGEDIEIIKLNGSIELAPLIGLSDVILDIVESGGTLKANGLKVLEEIYPISARLVANKVSLKVKSSEILPLLEKLKEVI